MRKHLLEYDDVMNQQRQVIYNRRRDLLERDSVRDRVYEIIEETIDSLLAAHAPEEAFPEEWLWEDMAREYGSTFFSTFPIEPEERVGIGIDGAREHLVASVRNAYDQRLQLVGDETFREVEKALLLHTVDTCWQEHLYAMDELKEGVGFVGIGGKNPLIEYKKGAFEMFESLIARIDSETMQNLFRLRIDSEAELRSPMRGGATARSTGKPPTLIPGGGAGTGSRGRRSTGDRHAGPAGRASSGPRARRRRQRRDRWGQAGTGSHRPQGRTQLTMPLWWRKKIQTLSRPGMKPPVPPP